MYYLQLKAIKASVVSTESAATAAKKSADVAQDSLLLLQRSYLKVDNWKGIITREGDVTVEFRISNPSPTPADIKWIHCTTGITEEETSTDCPITLAPQEEYIVTVFPDWKEGFQRNDDEAIEIRGEILYYDIFGKARGRRFARTCVREGPDGNDIRFYYPGSSGLNWEEQDWEGEGPKNPN